MMFKEIIINVQPFEKRIAVMEDNKLMELFIEREDKVSIVGNIYKGIVQDNLPGMGAAFINIGLERTAFLHYRDISSDFMDKEELADKAFLRAIEKDQYKKGELLKENDEILVQVEKAPIGTKGARLTGQITIPGKFLVLFPNHDQIAISRRIFSYREKARLRDIAKKVKDPNMGLIIRTASYGCSYEEFAEEYKNLKLIWKNVIKQYEKKKAPACLFNENDLTNVLIRDMFNHTVNRVVVDSAYVKDKIISDLIQLEPDLVDRVELYNEESPIFDAYGIEREIEKSFNSRIDLKSGGHIIIEQTEALVSIDVNTGSFIGNQHLEDTVLITNTEAAKEIARQIRLRDLSGIIVIDFIDMKSRRNQQAIYSTLTNEMKRDRSKSKIFKLSPLGLVEMARKRIRPSLLSTFSERCQCCNGTGKVLSRDSVALKIYRWLKRAENYLKEKAIEIYVHPNVYEFIIQHPQYFNENYPFQTEFIADKKINQGKFEIYSAITHKKITNEFNR